MLTHSVFYIQRASVLYQSVARRIATFIVSQRESILIVNKIQSESLVETSVKYTLSSTSVFFLLNVYLFSVCRAGEQTIYYKIDCRSISTKFAANISTGNWAKIAAQERFLKFFLIIPFLANKSVL